MPFTAKHVLITGSTSGIGRATALAFAREGAQVIISGRDTARGDEVVSAITQAGGKAQFLRADLTTQQGRQQLIDAALATVDKIDVLVNNAGIFTAGPTTDTDETTFDALMTTNVKAPYFLTARLAPVMAQQGGGKIINITTMAAQIGIAGLGLYGATKAALASLTRAWAAEFGPLGVNVNAIAPGPVRTPLANVLGDAFEQMGQALPAHRVAQPEEIAAAVLYLASDDAAFIHGAILPVDGGRTAI